MTRREILGTTPTTPPRPQKATAKASLPEGTTRDMELESYLLEALTEQRAKRDAESDWHDPTKDPRIHVSEYGEVLGKNACMRKLWYKRHGFKGEIGEETMMIFEIGNVVGLRLANIIAAQGDVSKVELAGNYDPWPLKGRLDVLTNDKLHRLIDWKTATTKQINYLPKEENFGQANQYMWALRRDNPGRYDDYRVVVVYVFKDPTRGQPPFLAFSRDYDGTRALEFLNASSKAFQIATGPVMPDRPEGFTISKFPCSYCPMAAKCWSKNEPQEGKS
jgi:hypothetical protein